MHEIVLSMSVEGIVLFGAFFLLLICWVSAGIIINGTIYLYRRIKHLPQKQHWYNVAYAVKKDGITYFGNDVLNGEKQFSLKNMSEITELIKRDKEADNVRVLGVTYLGKE